MTGFATKEGHPQECKLLGFLSPAVGICPCIAPEFEVSRFLRRQFQMELLHALVETFEKIIGIRLILEARHKVIGNRYKYASPRQCRRIRRWNQISRT